MFLEEEKFCLTYLYYSRKNRKLPEVFSVYDTGTADRTALPSIPTGGGFWLNPLVLRTFEGFLTISEKPVPLVVVIFLSR